MPAAVAVSPGGPTHVLISDEVAEHIAGCNMAFRRDVLLGARRLRPDLPRRRRRCRHLLAVPGCRLHDRLQPGGGGLAFPPQHGEGLYRPADAATARPRRSSMPSIPFRFNLFGQAKWLGRIYGDLSASLLLSRKPVIYSGVFGRGLFQTMYEPPSSLTAFLPLDLRVERCRAAAGARSASSSGGWWWLLDGAAADDLGDVRQRRAEGADRPALHRPQGARAGRAADLSRSAAARLGAPQMAAARRCRRDDHIGSPPIEQRGRIAWADARLSSCPIGTRAAPRRKRCSAG